MQHDASRKYKRKYNPHANSKSVFLLKVFNMRTTPLVALVFNRRHTATATKEAAVELRVSYKKQQKFMATGIKLLPKQWHRGTVVARVDAIEINKLLDQLVKELVYFYGIDAGDNSAAMPLLWQEFNARGHKLLLLLVRYSQLYSCFFCGGCRMPAVEYQCHEWCCSHVKNF